VLRTWGPAILAVLVIRTFIFEPFNIPSQSMVPTLLIGDYVFVTRSSYGLWIPATLVDIDIIPYMDNIIIPPRLEVIDWGDPQRGDVIVFRFPRDLQVNYIKRVVGVEGDTIEVKDNQVFVNGVPQERELMGQYNFKDAQCIDKSLELYDQHIGDVTHAKLLNREQTSVLSDRAPVVVPEGHVFCMGDNRDHSGDSREWGFVDEKLIKGKAHFIWLSWDSCEGSVRNRWFQSLYDTVEPNG